ncbi:hypothetical protein F5Y10DRAFT_263188 [Nemania abortiva]|nr:hypothetical protein F5Y10DRAFT_263188 [Nemania abortiva]
MDSSDAVSSTEHLLRSSDDFTDSMTGPSKARSARSVKLLRLWTLSNLVVSLALLGCLLYQLWPSPPRVNELLRKTSPFSPILETVKVQTFQSTIDGGIAAHSRSSIARLPPGPETDAAWERFEKIRTVVISKSDVEMMGKDPITAATFPDEHWGFGEDAYMGQLDIVHQLHCLNALHTELLTMNWIEEADYPFPDFSINKQCRDFETLLDWQAERAVDMDRWMNMTKPSGVAAIPGEKEWFQLFASNETSTAHDH